MTEHALDKISERKIEYDDIKQAILNGEIIENYPNAYPYPGCLVLGLSAETKSLHVVVGLGIGKLWVITAYYPTLNKWENDYKIRKAVK